MVAYNRSTLPAVSAYVERADRRNTAAKRRAHRPGRYPLVAVQNHALPQFVSTFTLSDFGPHCFAEGNLESAFPLHCCWTHLVEKRYLVDGRRSTEHKEFLLFSDCIVWLRPMDGHLPGTTNSSSNETRPQLGSRTRSRSDADLPKLRSAVSESEVNRMNSSKDGTKQWMFKGQINLIDLEVVSNQLQTSANGHRFDMHSPERSFALYASNAADRDEWLSAIRGARSSYMMVLSAIQPNTTLTSSASNEHVRRALQALPYSPELESSTSLKRGKVDHFLPPIWVPDHKSQHCMRCNKEFNWRRRRHHCRLCGRCICSSCAEKTFFISSSEGPLRKSSKAARSCNTCYETVFPVINPPTSSLPVIAHQDNGTLSSLPVWTTTKESDITSSILALLANSATQFTATSDQTSQSGESSRTASHLTMFEDDLVLDPPVARLHAHKRVSMPVLALQTTMVTAHPDPQEQDGNRHSVMRLKRSDDEIKRRPKASREVGPAAIQLQKLLMRDQT